MSKREGKKSAAKGAKPFGPLPLGKGQKAPGKSEHPGVWRGGYSGTGSGLPVVKTRQK